MPLLIRLLEILYILLYKVPQECVPWLRMPKVVLKQKHGKNQ